MRRTSLTSCSVLLFTLIASAAVTAHERVPNLAFAGQPAPTDDGPSLKVCLRLEDGSSFTGLANVRVTTPLGFELSGKHLESEGELLFAGTPPGTYAIEASAPGFLRLLQPVEIKPGQGVVTVFLVMKPETAIAPAPPTALPSRPAVPEPAEDKPKPAETPWSPPGVDAAVPAVEPGVSCSLSLVLEGAGKRMEEFAKDLEKFSATERVEHFSVKSSGERRAPEVRSFEYVVSVSQTPSGVIELDEYRNGTTDREQFPAGIATEGLPAMALIFHPLMQTDFNFACEGLGEQRGRPAWQVHFQQRLDRPNRIRSYVVGGNAYAVPLKGRAWIDAATFQVMRFESDLMMPIVPIELTKEHLSIDYAPVQFRTQGVQLWLPQHADLYVSRHGHRYYRSHSFDNFKIFTIEAGQKIQAPKQSYAFTNVTDHDISGILTVNPASGAALEPVSIQFTIPAGRSIFKVVGPGKDISIPVERVGSATFVHNGGAGSVKADAYFVKESTLDVISNETVLTTR